MTEESEQHRFHEQYWFNTQTRQVEVGRHSDWSHLMGPYPTREDAQRALEKAVRRTQDWDQEDERSR